VSEHRGATRRRRKEAEEDPQEGALAGAVRADEADDPGLELDGQVIEGCHAARVAFGQ
jgi:hypothetical protein